MRVTNFLLTMGAIAGLAAAQDSMTDAGAGWAPEFKMAGRQIITLAEAIPAEKYGCLAGSWVGQALRFELLKGGSRFWTDNALTRT